MCPGGGYRPPPDNSLELERMRQAAAERERQRLADEEAARRERAASALAAAETAARDRGRQYIASRGLSETDYANIIDRAITGARSNVPELDTNPGRFFEDSIFDNALNAERDLRRSRFTNEVSSAFAPGFERNAFTDDADDSFIDAILGTQRREAEDAVNRSFARGNLTEVGRQAAVNRINELATTGRAQAQSLGGAVLDRYRGRLRGISDRAREAAGSYNPGGSFSLDPFRQELDTTQRDLRGSLEGEVRGALSGQQFFDINQIINAAGAAQGAVNPRTELAAAISARRRRDEQARGVGGIGEF